MQIKKLSTAGFSLGVVVDVGESFVRVFRGPFWFRGKRKTNFKTCGLAAFYKVSHDIKKCATRHNLPVVFLAPLKVPRL